MYRSAGWPLLDILELELLAAGMLERVHVPGEAERLRLTDAGIAAAAAGAQRNRASLNAHEALVGAVVQMQQRKSHLAWRGLSLRVDVRAEHARLQALASSSTDPVLAPEKAKWVVAMPDVFSIRNTSVAAYLRPTVHEVKVKRADVLLELRKPLKTAAYLQMAAEVWMVLGVDAKGKPIALPEELPASMGVLQAWPASSTESGYRFELMRAAPQRTHALQFAHWMALAKVAPESRPESLQSQLGPA
jgi:hypothetical protein